MMAVESGDMGQKFNDMCAMVFGGETLIISVPQNERVVMLSEKRYKELEKQKRNAEYLAKIDRGFEQIKAGNGQVHELIKV